jgi:hypothetical protein
LSLPELLAIPQGEMCLAVVGPAEGPPVVVAVLEVKDKLPAAEKLLEQILIRAEASGVTVVTESHQGTDVMKLSNIGRRSRAASYFIREGTIVFTSDDELTRALIDVWNGDASVRTLADNKKFTAIMAQSVGTKEERPQISWFVDPIEFARTAGRGNLGAQTAIALLGPLGLDHLEAVGGSLIMATEDFDSIAHMHVLVKNPRQAVMKMLALDSGDLTPEAWVPKDAASYATIHWDFPTTFSEFAQMYDLIRFQEGAFSELVRSRVSDQLGADVQTELLPALAGRVTMATRIERPVRLNSETTAVGIQLKDPGEFQKILDKVMTRHPQALERTNYGTTTYYRIRAVGQRPPNFDESLMRLPSPAVVLLGDYLVLSDSEKFIEQCIITKRTPDSSLATDLEFKLVASRLQRHAGGRTPGMIGFQRPEENFRALYELATAQTSRDRISQASQENPFFRALDGALTQNPLPPFSAIARHLAPGGAMLINDDTGFHYIAFGLKRED